MTEHDYYIEEHVHRYAVWTAARAVQRSFAKTEKIKNAIEKSGLREAVKSSAWTDENTFDSFHEVCANKIMEAFKNENIPDVSYGRAAKIIAIYLKTTVIVASSGADKRCEFIHPPVDRILLSGLCKLDGLRNINKDPWTQLSQEKYWGIVNMVRKSNRAFNWKLEYYWDINKASDVERSSLKESY